MSVVPLYSGSGEADASEEELHRIPKISVPITRGKKCCAVRYPVQGLKAAGTIF